MADKISGTSILGTPQQVPSTGEKTYHMLFAIRQVVPEAKVIAHYAGVSQVEVSLDFCTFGMHSGHTIPFRYR